MLALSAITFSVNAQDNTGNTKERQHEGMDHGKWEHGQRGNQMMFKNLDLTESQKQQAQSINSDFENRMKELKKNDNMTVKDFNSQREALMQERKTKFEALLTPEQKAKMQDANKGMRGRPDMNDANRVEKMKTDLGLSNDQVSKLQSQQDAFKAKADAIRNNSALSDDQKREQFMNLRKEQHDNMKNILTADQLKKMEDRKGKRPMKTS